MSSRSEAPTEALIARVVDVIDARLGPQKVVCAEFARRYIAGVDPGELAGRATQDLYGAVVSHWQLGAVRPPRTPAVAVYNPDIDHHGWQSPHNVVDVVVDDMPFLVNSITMELSRHGLGIHVVLHPVMGVRRGPDGHVLDVSGWAAGGGAATDFGPAEAFVHVEVDRISDPAQLQELRLNLIRVLGDVRSAVEDRNFIVTTTAKVAEELRASALPEDESQEAEAFLHWLAADHFVFLGYRQYQLERRDGQEFLLAVVETGLGILRPGGAPASPTLLSPYAAALARQPQALVLSKTNRRSTVERPSHLDYFAVRFFDSAGEVTGEHRFLGLFTRQAYSTSCFEIPVIRRKAEAVIRQAGFAPDSHSGKSLVGVLETYQRDELLQASV